MENNSSVPMLFPIDPNEFWKQIRVIIREEIDKLDKSKTIGKAEYSTPGLTQKPLYKFDEVSRMFQVSRKTIHEWVKVGELRPVKIRSRVYFLWSDIEILLKKSKDLVPLS